MLRVCADVNDNAPPSVRSVLDEQAEVEARPRKRARTSRTTGIIRFYVEIIRLFNVNGIASDLPPLRRAGQG
jgi:hypothetical protein